LSINNLIQFEPVSVLIVEALTNPGQIESVIAFSNAWLSCHSDVAEQFMMHSIAELTAEKGINSSVMGD
jgi:hypothetical protein